MAVKKALRKRDTTNDWSWVGTEVNRPEDITTLHRRRAAGLIGGEPCQPRFLPANNTTSHTLDFDDQDGLSEASVLVTGDNGRGMDGCTAKRCKKWHLCLNHLGAEEVVDQEGKKRYIEEALGPDVGVREGPAGLRNLGATCYVSCRMRN
jgi:ubiquitin carboxyl-terminal hydrolase 48